MTKRYIVGYINFFGNALHLRAFFADDKPDAMRKALIAFQELDGEGAASIAELKTEDAIFDYADDCDCVINAILADTPAQ